MNYLFIIFLLSAMMAIALQLIFRRINNRFLAVGSGLLFYVVTLYWVNDIQAQKEEYLKTFDLDGNGVFTLEEQSKEQREAMHAVISDVGRNLAPVWAGIYAVVVGSIVWLFLKVVDKFLNPKDTRRQ